ncbi:unnamed protein product [Mytilus coruscus]|uniref:Uncharacterized protein n=1 Tax=Mytilus coruscus TaxID=42192 RepID=A0A6J8DIZ8_MYTCO|nr:unnamed protein product [Mytilus coruscus]
MVCKRISETQRWQNIGMRSTGMSSKAIRHRMGYHYIVVSRLVSKHIQTMKDLQRFGRPPITSHLDDSSLNKALQRQKSEILSEFKKTQVSSDNLNTRTIASGQASTTVFQPPSFAFKQEGIKIQFNFNTDRFSALRRVEHLLNSDSLDQTLDLQSIVKTELDALNQRNKILKIADRHGANRKRTANKPYSRGGGRGGFNARDFFRGFSKESGPRIDNYNQQNNFQQQYNDGLCFYCKRPGHTARFFPTKEVPSAVLSQHQPLFQVPHLCLNEQVDIEFNSYEYTDGTITELKMDGCITEVSNKPYVINPLTVAISDSKKED